MLGYYFIEWYIHTTFLICSYIYIYIYIYVCVCVCVCVCVHLFVVCECACVRMCTGLYVPVWERIHSFFAFSH